MFFPFIGEFTLMPRCFSRLSENSLWVSTLLTWRLDVLLATLRFFLSADDRSSDYAMNWDLH